MPVNELVFRSDPYAGSTQILMRCWHKRYGLLQLAYSFICDFTRTHDIPYMNIDIILSNRYNLLKLVIG